MSKLPVTIPNSIFPWLALSTVIQFYVLYACRCVPWGPVIGVYILKLSLQNNNCIIISIIMLSNISWYVREESELMSQEQLQLAQPQETVPRILLKSQSFDERTMDKGSVSRSGMSSLSYGMHVLFILLGIFEILVTYTSPPTKNYKE